MEIYFELLKRVRNGSFVNNEICSGISFRDYRLLHRTDDRHSAVGTKLINHVRINAGQNIKLIHGKLTSSQLQIKKIIGSSSFVTN